MPWKEETIMSSKEEFCKRAIAKEKHFSHLCTEYKITRKTGYLWVDRYIIFFNDVSAKMKDYL